ncbi:MAG: hypothetical protein FWF78_07710 [Defluviitaleaceae bacterium]|nr:hypothetical protein [Defluviitaleaceae bacterium]
MLKKIDYETIMYFFECYFCQTFYWDELKQQADDFASGESKKCCEQLKNELIQLRQNTWYDIKYFILKETGCRFKKEKDFNHLMDTILNSLQ